MLTLMSWCITTKQNNECCSEGAGIKINKKGQIVAKGQITSSIAAATSSNTPTPTSSSTDSQRTSSSSSSSSSATGTQTAGAVNANPSLPSPTPSSSGGLSSGAKAGIAIGCVAGAAIVAGLLYLLYRERRKSRALQGAAHHADAQAYLNNNTNNTTNTADKFKPANGGAAGGYGGGPEMPPQEMGTYDQSFGKWQLRGEMDGGQGVPQELPGGAGTRRSYAK
ncbi:MAG: hypothetical protein Q9203_007283 [Teloschistes exilis]